MENNKNGLQEGQALLSAPQKEKMEKSAQWFRDISLGTFLYAVVFAICLYKNSEGIGVPFGVGATLYFFYYSAKKCCAIARKGNVFLMVAVVILGIITCTTDSDVMVAMNMIGILLLVGIYLLELFYDVTGWSFVAYMKAYFFVALGGISMMGNSFSDGTAFLKKIREEKDKPKMGEKTREKLIAILVGILIAFPLLIFIVLMLASADILFREMSGNILDSIIYWELPEIFNRDFFGFLATIVIVFSFCYGIVSFIIRKKTVEKEVAAKSQKANSYIAISAGGMIALVYVVFAIIQIFGLFMGTLKLPEGYTYAEYARQGFFQLAFICFFNVCLVLICAAFFEEHVLLKWVMMIISACTYVMLGSSAYRMILYISVYHLTFLRVFVLWAILVMAIVMAGIIVFIVKKEFPIFRYMLVSISYLYIIFAVVHPDYWIATYNIEQAKTEAKIDDDYLFYDLSLDAAIPVLDYYAEDSVKLEVYCVRIEEETKEMNVRTFNLSKALASYKNGIHIAKTE